MEFQEEVLTQLAALHKRVEALEGRAPRDDAAGPDDSGDPFWILNGIKSRVDAPGAVFYAGAAEVAQGPVEWQIGRPVDDLLDEDWGAFAARLAALGNPVRLGLLHAVLGGATTVAELSQIEGMGTTGQLYHHVHQLVAHGWLKAAGRGKYQVPPERVIPLLVIVAATQGVA